MAYFVPLSETRVLYERRNVGYVLGDELEDSVVV